MKLSEKTQEIGVNPGFPPAQVTVAFASPATETPGMWPGHAHSCPRGCPGWGCSWLTSREQADTLLPRWPNLTTVLVVTHDSDTAPTDGNPSIRHLHPAGICSSGRPVVVQLLSGVWLLGHQGLQHSRLPCPSPSPGVCSNSCPLSHWWWSSKPNEASVYLYQADIRSHHND